MAAPLNLNSIYQRIGGWSNQSWDMVVLPDLSGASYGREDHLREMVAKQV